MGEIYTWWRDLNGSAVVLRLQLESLGSPTRFCIELHTNIHFMKPLHLSCRNESLTPHFKAWCKIAIGRVRVIKGGHISGGLEVMSVSVIQRSIRSPAKPQQTLVSTRFSHRVGIVDLDVMEEVVPVLKGRRHVV